MNFELIEIKGVNWKCLIWDYAHNKLLFYDKPIKRKMCPLCQDFLCTFSQKVKVKSVKNSKWPM